MKVRAPFDLGSLVVIAITLLLFAWALFEKGLTHDLLLEAGVLMVSVKLIIMSYKNSLVAATIDSKLDRIVAEMTRQERRAESPGPPGEVVGETAATRPAGSGPGRL
jgi:hypothetical protein